MPTGLNILTNSRLDAFQRCRKAHQNAYGYGVRREPTEALRIGTAVHEATAMVHGGHSIDEAIQWLGGNYAKLIDASETTEREAAFYIEHAKCCELVRGWFNRWAGCGITAFQVEQSFNVPIVNPETGYPAQNYTFGGKMDALVWLEDGRLALLERKTTGMSIDSGSDYWVQLRLDQQLSRYLLVARSLGHDVMTILYDVIRKPEISPKQVAELDGAGLKVVVDAQGQRAKTKTGTWRQSGDKELGLTLMTRTETVTEYRDRLREDIAARPDFYFARVEIPRLQADLDETAQELWDLQKTVREAENTGRHYRNVRSCLSPFRCEYLESCSNGVDLAAETPEGFVRLTNIHPELGESHEHGRPPEAPAEICTTV